MTRPFTHVWASLILLTALSTDLFGQGAQASASVRGVITDSSGAGIPGAQVTLTDPDKGVARKFLTTENGGYDFSLVPPGDYTLKVEKAGFGTYTQSHLTLGLGQVATQDVRLQVGNISQSVSVTAQAPNLNAEDANVTSELNQSKILETPLNIRSPFSLALLSSSVNNGAQQQVLAGGAANSYGNADQDSGFFNFGGTRFGGAAYLLDGHWLVSGDWGGISYAPSVDEVQEMKIQTNTFSAQYGWSEGNVVNVISKGGTRDFHGDGFEFFRNSVLDANLFFNNKAGIAKPDFTRNQYGVSAGGPLYLPGLYRQRDKTFIFGLFEGRRASIPNSVVTTVPTNAMRLGDFSALLGSVIGTDALGRPIRQGQIYNPFTTRPITSGQIDPVTGLIAQSSGFIRDPFDGNIIASKLIDPVAAKLLQYWPGPTGPGLVNNYSTSVQTPAISDQYTIRVDQNFSDNQRLFVRWAQKRLSQSATSPYLGPNNPAGPGSVAPNNRWDAGLGFTQVFSPTLVMSLTGGWVRWIEARVLQGYPFDSSSLGLPTSLDGGPFPRIAPQNVSALGWVVAGTPAGYPHETRTHAVDMTKIHGSQTINFGFMWLNFRTRFELANSAAFNFPASFTIGPNPTAANPATGSGFASFILGTGNGGGYTQYSNPSFYRNSFGWYIQDDWKITSRLTVNLGLRYDIQTAPKEGHNQIAYLDTATLNPISSAIGFPVHGELVYTTPQDRGNYNPQYTNVAPRLGLAWRPIDRLVVRAGGGLYYMTASYLDYYRGLTLPGYSQTTPYVGTTDGLTPLNLLRNPFPTGLLQPSGNSLGPLTNVGQNVDGFQRSRPTPYLEQWTLGLQFALTQNDRFEAAYVGNHGVKLLAGPIQINQIPDQDLSLGNSLLTQVANPFYGHIASSSCGLSAPTVQRSQLLRPYPEFCSVVADQFIGGSSSYHALQLTYSHRFHSGLEILASFTGSKFLSTTSGNENWVVPGSSAFQDYNNLAAEKSLDGSDIPKAVVISYVYELPFGKGRRFGTHMPKSVDAIVGGWQIAGINTFKDGLPLFFTNATNNTFSLGGGQRPNVTGNPLAPNPTIQQWLNAAAFSQPAPFTFGNEPRYDPHARGPGFQNIDFTLAKWFYITERIRAQLRAEAFNFLNRPNFYQPNTTFGSPSFGQITAAFPSRSIQIGAKVYW